MKLQSKLLIPILVATIVTFGEGVPDVQTNTNVHATRNRKSSESFSNIQPFKAPPPIFSSEAPATLSQNDGGLMQSIDPTKMNLDLKANDPNSGIAPIVSSDTSDTGSFNQLPPPPKYSAPMGRAKGKAIKNGVKPKQGNQVSKPRNTKAQHKLPSIHQGENAGKTTGQEVSDFGADNDRRKYKVSKRLSNDVSKRFDFFWENDKELPLDYPAGSVMKWDRASKHFAQTFISTVSQRQMDIIKKAHKDDQQDPDGEKEIRGLLVKQLKAATNEYSQLLQGRISNQPEEFQDELKKHFEKDPIDFLVYMNDQENREYNKAEAMKSFKKNGISEETAWLLFCIKNYSPYWNC